MREDTCFVITGLIPANKDYMLPLLDLYKDVKNKILSTWEDQPWLEVFERNGFRVILNEYPFYKNSTNYQTVCIREGCIVAEELGFKYVIRMRTDLICNDITKFLNSMPLDNNKLCVLGFVQTHTFYIIDFFMGGLTQEMLKIFNKEQTEDDVRFVEQYWMEEYFGKTLTYEDAKNNINTCYDIFNEKRVEMTLLTKHWSLVLAQYCKEDFFRH